MKHQIESRGSRKARAARLRRRQGWMVGRQNIQDYWKRRGSAPLW